jgi:hypothetical protein
VAELPGLFLRVTSIEVGEQSVVGQVPEARAVIRHAVGGPADVEGLVKVPVLALVETAEPAEVGGWRIRREGALAVSRESWGVVRARGDGELAGVVGGADHGGMSHQTRLLEVAVG